MRIGIVPALDGLGGGVYQYSVSMLQALKEAQEKGECTAEFVFITDNSKGLDGASWWQGSWQVRSLNGFSQEGRVKRHLAALPGHEWFIEALRWLDGTWLGLNLDRVRYRPKLSAWLRDLGVDLMLYPAPRTLAFEADVPYVMAIHDLQHRLQPEFPEVSANGQWNRREYLFRNGARRATLILADSETGKEDILKFYGEHGVSEDRVKVLPFLPANYLPRTVTDKEKQRVWKKYRLPSRYIFYPAQFWPHKNHGRTVAALGLLKRQHHVNIPIVLCGSHTGMIRQRSFREVMSLVGHLGLEEQVRYLDYVPDRDIAALYAGAVALVMPTFFGPTNIPPLEAWTFGCPVLSSDIRGIRDQIGDAGVLVDPGSVDAIAHGIHRLWTEEGLRQELARRGRRKLESYTPDHYRKRLLEILEEAKLRLRSSEGRRNRRQ